MDDAEFRIIFDNPVHCQMREQPPLPWQGCIQEWLEHGMKWYLPFCGLGLQLSYGIGLDLDEPSQQVPCAGDISCREPTDLP